MFSAHFSLCYQSVIPYIGYCSYKRFSWLNRTALRWSPFDSVTRIFLAANRNTCWRLISSWLTIWNNCYLLLFPIFSINLLRRKKSSKCRYFYQFAAIGSPRFLLVVMSRKSGVREATPRCLKKCGYLLKYSHHNQFRKEITAMQTLHESELATLKITN